MTTRDPDFPLVPHYTIPHVRLQASGTLGANTGNEIWAMGLKFICTAAGAPTVPVAPAQADVDEIADAGMTAFTTLIKSVLAGATGAGALFPTDVKLTETKAYAVAADNHADPALQTTYRFPLALVEGQGDNGFNPYSVAIVISFAGDLFRKGLAAHGRIYLPNPEIGATAAGAVPIRLGDGRMSAETVTGFANAGKTLIQTLKSASPTTNLVHVPSMVGVSKVNAGLARWQPITHVLVDDRPDTVRRRSNKLGGKGKVTTTIT